MNDSNKVLIVAGEESSSVYAQRLLEHWRESKFPVRAFGVGSQSMEKLGFERLGKSEEMAVVGIQEVLSQFPLIYKVFHSIIDRVRKEKPPVALLLDYPDFNLRLAKRLKSLGVSVVYYISPQLWAWRSSRIHHIKKYVDKMLVVFPFEEDFYKSHGVEVEFVGHPLLDEIEKFHHEAQVHDLPQSDYRLGLMPGSRKSEIKHHLKTQLEVGKMMLRQDRNVRVELLVAPSLDLEWLKDQLRNNGEYSGITLVQDTPLSMIERQDIILCASGTATLLVGLMEKPFIAMYKMNPVSAFLATRLIRSVEHFCIVNLVLKKPAIPEFFQGEATAADLYKELLRLREDEPHRLRMLENLKTLKSKLGRKGATSTVHKSLLPYWTSPS